MRALWAFEEGVVCHSQLAQTPDRMRREAEALKALLQIASAPGPQQSEQSV